MIVSLVLLAPGRPAILRYLVTLAGFYLVVGLAFGAGPLLTAVLTGRPGYWAELVIGVALFALSFRFKGREVNWAERVARAPRTLALRRALSERLTSLLTKVNGWFERHASGATGWILAVVGFLVARDAALHLGFFNVWLND